MTPKFGDLIGFILKNKSDKTFIGMSQMDIIYYVRSAIEQGTLLYNLNELGVIDGMIMGELRPEDKVLFITENLAISKENLQKFAKVGRERWPEYKLEWLKRGIHKQHDTNKIYTKFTV